MQAGARSRSSVSRRACRWPLRDARRIALPAGGARPMPDGVNFCVFSRHADARRASALRGSRQRRAVPGDRARRPDATARSSSGTCSSKGCRRAPATPGASTGRRTHGRRAGASTRARSCSTPGRGRSATRCGTGAEPPDPQDAGHASLRAIVTEPPAAPREPAAPRGLERRDDLRAARRRLHASPLEPACGTRAPSRAWSRRSPTSSELGVTHVELLPVMAFDEQDVPAAVAARGLGNYWGYSTAQLLQPAPALLRRPGAGAAGVPGAASTRCTTRASACCSTWCSTTPRRAAPAGRRSTSRALANEIFYHLDAGDRRRYRDYTGCGNTVNCNHPLVTRFIVHCLEYWVERAGRRRLPLRPGERVRARRGRRADGRSAAALERSSSRASWSSGR